MPRPSYLSTLPDTTDPSLVQPSEYNDLVRSVSEYHVRAYGAVGDGVTDDTPAFVAAMAAVPVTGGTVVFDALHAINLTILRPKIRLVGRGIGRIDSATNPGGLRPYDVTQSVITIGNDTALVQGVQLADIEFFGGNTGYYGLKMLGGCYSQWHRNITFQGFVKKGLWVESGAAYPIAYVFFDGFGVQPYNSAAHEHNILIKQGNAAKYCEAIYFDHVRNVGVPHGLALENAGSFSLSFSNAYFQLIHDAGAPNDCHGVRLSMPFATMPQLNGNGLSLDSDDSNDTLLEINFGSSTAPIDDYVRGFVDIDGKVNVNGTRVVNQSPMHLPNRTKMVYGTAHGALYLADGDDPNSQDCFISGETGAGRANMVAPNEVVLSSGIGVVLHYAPAIAAPYHKIQNATGIHKLIANALDLELSPPSGGAAAHRADTTKFGATTQYTLVVDSAIGLIKFNQNLCIPNAKDYYQFAADGVTPLSVAKYNGSNNLFVGNGVTGAYVQIQGVTNVKASIGATTKTDLSSDRYRPNVDDDLYLGDVTHRWKEVFAINGTITTSDERAKQEIAPIDDRLLDAWATVDYVQYRWRSAVDVKGADARIHTGVIAQRILAAFAAHKLDAHRYGLFTFDQWDEHQELDGVDLVDETYEEEESYLEPVSPDDPENMVVKTRTVKRTRQVPVERYRTVAAGDRYGVRADECLMLEAALQRRTTQRLEARLAKLEQKNKG